VTEAVTRRDPVQVRGEVLARKRVGAYHLIEIAAGGVAPTPEDPAPVDGPPALRTEIRKARVR